MTETDTYHFEDGSSCICYAATYRPILGTYKYGLLFHNLNGPAYIPKRIHMGKEYQSNYFYIYGKYIGGDLSSEEFEIIKNKELKKIVFS